jgi:hypothetical protein
MKLLMLLFSLLFYLTVFNIYKNVSTILVTAFTFHNIVHRQQNCRRTTFNPVLVDGSRSSSLLQSSSTSSSNSINTNNSNSSYENRMLAQKYIQQGMLSFRLGNVLKSIELFNLAEQIDTSITPYLWQRGISYYYNQQYKQASDQFRIDVQVNPFDVEEIVWDIASQVQYNKQQQRQHDVVSKTKPIFPIPNQLSLPSGAKDRRRIMV